MLALYLFSLIFGGGLLLLSLLGGEGGEGELDLELDTADLEVEGLADAGEVDGGGEAAAKIFSLRSLIYALFGFGATGSLLTWLGVGTLPTAVTAVLGGLLSGALVSLVFGYLHRTDSGALPGDADLVGLPGRVVLPLGPGTSHGAVVVERGGRWIRLRALPHSTADGDPEAWGRVVVVEVEGGVAQVAPLEDDGLLDS